MRAVIITGADGFIGSSLAKRFVDNNIHVVAIDRSFSKNNLPIHHMITRIQYAFDSNAKEVAKDIPKHDYIAFYHFAWQGVNGADKGIPEIQVNNINLMLNAVRLAKQLSCKRFLCAGTIAEEAIHSIPSLDKLSAGVLYGVSKVCAKNFLETFCKIINQEYVWMKFSNAFGPDNHTGNLLDYTIKNLLSDKAATFGPANQMYDFIFFDDLLEAVTRLGLKENLSKSEYFIGSGTPRILKDYLLEVGRQLGKSHLVKLGERPDDGIKYYKEMFDIVPLLAEIGNYITGTYEEHLNNTIDSY